ncbi:MAG: uroporphyrinogen decarboxylase [Cryomorphaceae bacterium]|nr:uroporphyrinogen decarboxylase [Flavobacteriales bacterium]
MSTPQNDLILRVAHGEHTEHTPVWLMRQAGRILPEYRAVRASLSGFKELVETPEKAAEVTIQPVDILGVDAAIIFSDILVIPEAMGLPYQMIEKRGPHFEHTISSEADFDRIRVADASDLGYVYEAIKHTLDGLGGRVPLIGFAGAPFTILCYMVEGSGSKTFSKARKMLVQRPDLAHKLMGMITESTVTYLRAQIGAGVHMVQVFDSWAGILSPADYRSFCIPYLKTICDALEGTVPVTLFAKGAHYSYADLAALSCNTVGVDWNTPPEAAREAVGMNRTLQGNLDPAALYGNGKEIVKATTDMLRAFGKHRHIANLGHGVYPDTSPDNVKIFIDTVKSFQHE